MSATASEDLAARHVQARAVEWVVARNVSETWSDENQIQLDAWMNEAPAHLLAYWRAEDSWNRTELLAALRTFRPRTPASPRIWVRWVAAIAITGMIGSAAAAYLTRSVEKTYTTPVGGRETLTLADGSQIELNTDTVLRVGTHGQQRTATLEKGEAFFQIRHDSTRPFIVTAFSHRIIDLGTKFTVRAEGRRIRVALVEGLARVETPDANDRQRPVLLEPGDVAVASDWQISLTKQATPQLIRDLGWRRGILIFDNTALADVAAEFNRYNRQKIVLADAKIGRLAIIGTFPSNDLQAVINTAREVFNLHVSQQGDRIRISR